MYLVACNGLVAATWEFRFTMVRGWILVLTNPRSFWRLEEWKTSTSEESEREQHTAHSTSTEDIHYKGGDVVQELTDIDLQSTTSNTSRGFDDDLELQEIREGNPRLQDKGVPRTFFDV